MIILSDTPLTQYLQEGQILYTLIFNEILSTMKKLVGGFVLSLLSATFFRWYTSVHVFFRTLAMAITIASTDCAYTRTTYERSVMRRRRQYTIRNISYREMR